MKTKTLSFLLSLLVVVGMARAADSFTATFQQGLFEEEVNRNFAAAIQAYETVLRQADDQRRIAATALFRLGECQRKQGRTNEAVAMYQRVLRDYSDQAELVALCREQVAASAPAIAKAAARSGPPMTAAQLRLLEEELRLVDGQIETVKKQMEVGKATTGDFTLRLRDRLALQRQLPQNSAPDNQRKLIEEERKLVQELLEEMNKRITVGAAPPDDAIPLRRDLLSLERRLLEVSSATEAAAATAAGDAIDLPVLAREFEELAREPRQEIEARDRQIAQFQQQSSALLLELSKLTAQLDLIQDTPTPEVLPTRLEESSFTADYTWRRRQVENCLQRPQDEATQKYIAKLRSEMRAWLKDIYLKQETARLDGLKQQAENIAQLIDQARHEQAALTQLIETRLKEFAEKNHLTPDQARRVRYSVAETAKAEPAPASQPPRVVFDVPIPKVDEQAKEIERLQALFRNSPDLVNAKTSGYTPLFVAVEKKQRRVVEFLLEHQADLEVQGERGETVLFFAVRQGDLDIAGLLLEHRANPNKGGVLHLAAATGNKEMAALLLKHGALANGRDRLGRTPLHLATREGFRSMAELLVANGAEVNVRTTGVDQENNSQGRVLAGSTPLHLAVIMERPAMIGWLCDRKADLEAQDELGRTPLHLAAREGNTNLIALLLAQRANPHARSKNQATPFGDALGSGRPEAVEVFLKLGVNPNAAVQWDAAMKADGTSDSGGGSDLPLLRAVKNQNRPLAELLLRHQADPNLTNSADQSPLLLAIQMGGDTAMAELLLDRGANVQQTFGIQRWSPLHEAVNRNNARLVELLLTRGADVNARTINGRTPLHEELDSPSDTKIVALLLNHKPDVNVVDNSGNTPLSMATDTTRKPRGPASRNPAPQRFLALSQIAQMLRDHGALEGLERSFAISVLYERSGAGDRPANAPTVVFSRGTNTWNRHTLFELMAQTDFNFPVLTNLTIQRIDLARRTTQLVPVDLEAALKSGDPTRDIMLEWGDLVIVPERDHKLDAPSEGMSNELRKLLRQHLRRQVRFVTKGETVRVTLDSALPRERIAPMPMPLPPGTLGGPVSDGGNLSSSTLPPRTSLATEHFWLRAIIRQIRVLHTSSDLSRVTVKRVDPLTKVPVALVLDLRSGQDVSTGQGIGNDLWLRDGDVIEIPDKP